MAAKKKKFVILLDGEKVGESWAVSAEKAITNHWWKFITHLFTSTISVSGLNFFSGFIIAICCKLGL